MLTQELIIRKRNGHELSAAEIRQYISGVTDKSVSESQIAAMSMAILLKGLSRAERVTLTMAMADSGTRLDWTAEKLGGPVLDKHSTGGVGDKVSLMLAPIIAACGGFVPMISGRGLGHTGGTLDKMDSIPGYVSQPSLELLKKAVKASGHAVVGATSDIAPADKIIYAVRDVTGTVESLDLITASILSKKLAAGLNGLVMDVKFGSGAFMQKYEDAAALARSLAGVANGAGLRCAALMTDMNEVLGRAAGNAVEVREAVQFLRGENIEKRLYDVTMALCAQLLVLGGLAKDTVEGFKKSEASLRSGKAAELCGKSIAALGGPADFIENYEQHLPRTAEAMAVYSEKDGYLSSINVRQIGIAIIELGGGRRVASDKIDHAVGLTDFAAIGEKTGRADRPLCIIHARSKDTAEKAAALLRAACVTSPQKPATKSPVSELITSE